MDERERPDNSDAERAFGDEAAASGADAFGRPHGFEPPRAPDTPPPPPPATVGDTGFAPPVPPPPPPPGRPPAGRAGPVTGPGSTWPPPPAPDQPPVSGKATTALVLGIVSWLICPIVLSVMAMIYARQAQREIDADPAVGGRGRAEAAFWIGATSLIVYGLLLAISLIVGIAGDGS